MSSKNVNLTCSFCGKKQTEVEKIIQGPYVTICNLCVDHCRFILDKDNNKNVKSEDKEMENISISELKSFVDQYVIGQEQAKKILCVGVYNHYKRIRNPIIDGVELEKENIIMVGPTASGKTALVKALSRKLRIPFVTCDSTTLSEVGYVGADPDTILKQLVRSAAGDINKAQNGIIFIDEIDKKSKRETSNKDASGEGVQYSLLKMVEGGIVELEMSTRNNPEKVKIDTSNILFIVAGAFSGIENVMNRRMKKRSIGFNDSNSCDTEEELILSHEDIINYGMIPELIGRFPILAKLEKLSEEEIVKVLLDTKNSIIKQYEAMFSIENIKLTFTENSIRYIASESVNSLTGVRGIRSFIEDKLLDVQFNIENYVSENVKEIILDDNFFSSNEAPTILYETKN